MPPLDEPFADRVERLKQELALAMQWNRPSLLLVIYSSAFVQAEAADTLEDWVREQGQRVARVHVSSPDDPAADLPRRLYEWPDREQTVFFVSGLAQGAPTTWNSLNIRREYFVQGCVRAVFWLTEAEAAQLPLRAPDFWVFRHRTVEFIEPPTPGESVTRKAEQWAWEGFEQQLPPEERHARIAFREQLLAELPADDETAPTRAQLHYTLGGLYYWDKQYDKAIKHFLDALSLAEKTGNRRLQSWIHNGLGNVYAKLGRYEEAIAAYQHAIELDPQYAYPHNGLGNVYQSQGRYEEAIAAYQHAIELDPQYAYPHNGLGNVYDELGRYEEAIAAYQHAIELDPQLAQPHNNLGNVYRAKGRYEEAIDAFQQAVKLNPSVAAFQASYAATCRALGREEEYQEHIRHARELMEMESDYNKACIEAIAGNTEAALEHLARALERNPGSRAWAARDPDLASLRDHPRFRQLVGTSSA